MPTFQYEALNDAGKPKKATIDAPSSDDAIAKLRTMGLFPTSIREQKVKKTREAAAGGKAAPGAGAKPGGKKKMGEISIQIGGVSTKMLTLFTRQFSTLQDAGLPILRSLQILEQQQKPGLLKNTLRAVQEDVSGGATLSDAMAKHPKAFDKLYTKMIAAGEIGGVLDVILQRLAMFMEKAAKLKRKIIGAMVYPAVVITVAALIVLGIMIVVVPKFEKIFDDFQTELPAMTQLLMGFSRFLMGKSGPQAPIPGVLIMLLSPVIIYFVIKLARKATLGRKIVDNGILMFPVMGNLVGKTAIARFTRTLGTLISAGVPILDAISITRETTGNYVFYNALGKVHDSVRQGESFAEPLRQAKVCDNIVVNMIDVGEETGDLDKMLMKIADNYDEEVDVLVDAMVSLLEPFMVVSLGAIVGFIVAALFMPLVKLIQAVS
ncbi:MAG: type II secretion system F family protein [Phycisphaera sp.]|nr:type II secretion system F family protein [Phycisphaera sp.]